VADLYNNPEKVVPTGVDNTALKLWLPMQEGAGTTAYNGAPDALGSELVTNGDFASDTWWQKSSSNVNISNGKGNYTAGTTEFFYKPNTLTIGKTYKLVFEITDQTAGYISLFGGSFGPPAVGVGTYERVFTCVDTTFGLVGNTFRGSIDNVSVQEASGFGTISGATWTHGIGAPVAQTAVINWNKYNTGTNAVLIPQGLTSGRDLLGNLFENVRKQGALNLDGNSWAEVHDNASFDFGTNVSLEAWGYWQGDNDDDGIIGRYGSITAERDCTLYAYSGGIQFYVTANAVSYTSMTNGWRHIVGTYDGANKRLYVDGVQVNSSAETSTMPGGSIPVEIGRYNESAATTFTQPIAQPRIYNRALTAAEVQKNYNAGKNTYTN
jgi:hypothetical protein